MSKKVKDCIDDKLKGFRPVGNTPKERAEDTRKAFKKAAEDCISKDGE